MDSKPDVSEKLKAFHKRNDRLLQMGFDRAGAARFIVESAGTLHGPALDVGTGKGILAVELARSGMNVVSVDQDGEEQELAAVLVREAGFEGQIQFIREDAAHLKFQDEYFGCAAMMDVLHHLEKPKPVLLEMARVVRRGGILVVSDFDEEGFSLLSRVHQDEGREHPRMPITMDKAVEFLMRDGFLCSSRIEGYLHHVAVLTKEL